MEKDSSVHDFLKDIDTQISLNCKKKKRKIFGFTFVTLNAVLFFLLYGLFHEAMKSSVAQNPFYFYGLVCGMVFLLGIISWLQARSMIRYSLIYSLKFDSKWEEINLYQFLEYVLKKDNNELTDEQLETLVSQHFEKYRLKENLELTALTSDIFEKKELDAKKIMLNSEYQAKERKYSLINLFGEYL